MSTPIINKIKIIVLLASMAYLPMISTVGSAQIAPAPTATPMHTVGCARWAACSVAMGSALVAVGIPCAGASTISAGLAIPGCIAALNILLGSAAYTAIYGSMTVQDCIAAGNICKDKMYPLPSQAPTGSISGCTQDCVKCCTDKANYYCGYFFGSTSCKHTAYKSCYIGCSCTGGHNLGTTPVPIGSSPICGGGI